MSLLALVDHALLSRGSASALDAQRPDGTFESFTFGQLEARSNRVAQVLVARGIARGDRVAFLLPNRVEIIDLWLACLKLGVIAVPINVLYQAREIRHVVTDAEPFAVITTTARHADVSSDVRVWEIDALNHDAAQWVGRDNRALLPTSAVCDADTPAALVYTSGTTGASKGAVLTHGNFAANGLAVNASWNITSNDRLLCTLPLFHVHGLANAVHAWLLSGCHMMLTERFEAERAAAWFTSYTPTLFFGVPTMYVRLLEIDMDVARTIGARARLFVSGSAPLPAPRSVRAVPRA